MSLKSVMLTIVAGALVILVALTIWPTAYRYHHDGERAYREHRITGDVYYLTTVGWLEAVPYEERQARAETD